MTTKIYAVYAIVQNPSYCLEALFKTKELAKKFIEDKRNSQSESHILYDIQVEDLEE